MLAFISSVVHFMLIFVSTFCSNGIILSYRESVLLPKWKYGYLKWENKMLIISIFQS